MLPTSRTAARARLATLAAVLALLATLAVRPVLGPVGARAMGPLPACRYDDILTTPRGYADWPTTLVDTILRVPKGYVPPDLVSTAQAGIAGGGKVRAVMIDDLRAMAKAAAAAGNAIGVESAYRSYQAQQLLFDDWVDRVGYEQALEVPARPGHSEHQLGLAVDLRTEPERKTAPFGSTPAGSWVRAHAWEYGFVLSYPKGAEALTCYQGEPWHVRYVGRKIARLIHTSGLTAREYLWANFTTTVIPLGPFSSTQPSKSAGPTASAAPLPSLVPSRPPASPSPSPVVATGAPVASEGATPTPALAGTATEAATTSQPVLLVGLGMGLLALGSAAFFVRRRGQSGVGL